MLTINQLAGFGNSRSILPPEVPGLQFWVRSDLGVTKDGSDLVSDWADLSGNGRNATESTNKPLWVTSLISGCPAIRFDGTNDKLLTGSFTVNQPLTVFVVSKNVTNTNADRVWASSTSTANPSLLQRAGPNLTLQSNNLDGATVVSDTTNFHLYKCVFNGTSSVIAKDNGSDQTNAGNLSGSITRMEIGAWNAGNFGNVEIAEMAVYDSTISGTNLTNLLVYFRDRYALW
jgi:hypothetical protein